MVFIALACHLHWDKRFPHKILKTGCGVDLIGSARYLKLYYIKKIFAFETLIKNDAMSDFTAVITNTEITYWNYAY